VSVAQMSPLVTDGVGAHRGYVSAA